MSKTSAPVSRAAEIEALREFASRWAEQSSYLGSLFTPAMVELVVSRINSDMSPNLAADLEHAQETVSAHRKTIGELEHNLELSHTETIRAQNEGDARVVAGAELLSEATAARIAAEDLLTDERQKVANMGATLEAVARLASHAWLDGMPIAPEALRAVLKD